MFFITIDAIYKNEVTTPCDLLSLFSKNELI